MTKPKLKRRCMKCGDILFNRKKHAKYCKECADDIFKEQRKEGHKRYILKNKI